MAALVDDRQRSEDERLSVEGGKAGSARRRVGFAALLALVPILAVVLVTRVGGGQGRLPGSPPVAVRGPGHVHGLGVNPRDGALFIATHTGLFRLAEDESRPVRVGESSQDTMGFTVVGPDRFLGSGHPDEREPGPALLGLVDSRDAGRSWRPVSLSGQADLHLLRALGSRVFGADSSSDRFLASDDGGRTWTEHAAPRELIDLALEPRDGGRMVASTRGGLRVSTDDGRTWTALGETAPGLLSWAAGGSLLHVDASGRVKASSDRGRTWEPRGSIGAQPVSFTARDRRSVYAALPDGRIMASTDGAKTWTTRARP